MITVKNYKSNTRCHSVTVNGPSELVYSPKKPLKCGATVWLESKATVTCK